MTKNFDVVKYGNTAWMSAEALRQDPLPDLVAHLDRALNATPEERAQMRRAAADREARELWTRIEQRNAAEAVPLTLDALLAKMGWERAYAEHLVQPYCGCGEDIDGWSYCDHARDLGLAP